MFWDEYYNIRMLRNVEEICFQKGKSRYSITSSTMTVQDVLDKDFGGVTTVLKKILVNIDSVLDLYRVAGTLLKGMLKPIILTEDEQEGMLLNFFCCSVLSYRVIMWLNDPLKKEILLRQDSELEMHLVACKPMIEYLYHNGVDVHDPIAISELIHVLKWENYIITPINKECYWN